MRIRHNKANIAALLDTVASKSIGNKSFVLTRAKHGYKVVPQATNVFTTMGQDVTSGGTIIAQFRFTKRKADSFITHRFQVIEDSKDATVIGR